MHNMKAPVIGKDGEARMPAKASRVRRWIKEGKAVKQWNKLGIFYVQLTGDSGNETEFIVLNDLTKLKRLLEQYLKVYS